MKSVELTATLRDEVRKKSALNNLRKAGNVPAVLYGSKENINFSVNDVAFSKVIYTDEVYMIELNFGDKTTRAVIQDIQFNPVTDAPIHIDFIEVVEDKAVSIGIPVRFVGSSIGVRNGGKRREKLRKVICKALPKDLPQEIEIDVTPLRIGQDVKVRDLNIEGVEFMNSPNAVIVAVKTSRVAVEEEEEDEEGEEGAEEGETAPAEAAAAE